MTRPGETAIDTVLGRAAVPGTNPGGITRARGQFVDENRRPKEFKGVRKER
jgi:hypothetical protein